jgi:hypothetical protein
MSNTPAMAARLRPMRCLKRHSRPSPAPPVQCLALQSTGRFISFKREGSSQQPDVDAGDRPFQTQLWDSTYQRVQREREERKKYGAMQNFGEGTAANGIAWIACKQPDGTDLVPTDGAQGP